MSTLLQRIRVPVGQVAWRDASIRHRARLLSPPLCFLSHLGNPEDKLAQRPVRPPVAERGLSSHCLAPGPIKRGVILLLPAATVTNAWRHFFVPLKAKRADC